MGRLEDVREYLAGRLDVVREAETRLGALLAKYETFFQEVSRAREHELDQLVEATLADPASLPGWYREAVDRVRPEVEAELAARRRELGQRRDALLEEAEALREASARGEAALAEAGRERDARESELEDALRRLEGEIAGLDARIRSLSRGLGFLTNWARMRPLARRRRKADAERRELAAKLEALRTAWAAELSRAREAEERRRTEWVAKETDAAAVAARLEALELEAPRIVARTVVERVLGGREGRLPEGGSERPCPRCGMPNPEAASFCRTCALRLAPDREDFAGSVEEIAELEVHHGRFAEGMKAAQEALALVRGIRAGLEALVKSVDGMIEARDGHGLGELDLEVPASSVAYGALFDEIAAVAGEGSRLHPREFARRIREVTEGRTSKEELAAYFEAIGNELSRAAGERWD